MPGQPCCLSDSCLTGILKIINVSELCSLNILIFYWYYFRFPCTPCTVGNAQIRHNCWENSDQIVYSSINLSQCTVLPIRSPGLSHVTHLWRDIVSRPTHSKILVHCTYSQWARSTYAICYNFSTVVWFTPLRLIFKLRLNVLGSFSQSLIAVAPSSLLFTLCAHYSTSIYLFNPAENSSYRLGYLFHIMLIVGRIPRIYYMVKIMYRSSDRTKFSRLPVSVKHSAQHNPGYHGVIVARLICRTDGDFAVKTILTRDLEIFA